MKETPLGPGAVEWLGTLYRTTLPTEATGGTMSITDSVSPPGFGPPRHIHHDADETFVMLTGDAEFWLAGDRFICGPGQAVFIPRGTEHTFRIVSEVPSRHLVILTPGRLRGVLRRNGSRTVPHTRGHGGHRQLRRALQDDLLRAAAGRRWRGGGAIRRLSAWFFAAGAIFALVGMPRGILTSASHDHALSPAHGHLNLFGFVAMSIFGARHALTPPAAHSPMAVLHCGLTVATVLVLTPGIARATSERGETPAPVGSIPAVPSMAPCALVVLRHGAGSPARPAG